MYRTKPAAGGCNPARTLAKHEKAQALLDRDFRGVMNEIGGGAALRDRRLGQKARGEHRGLAVGMDDVGLFEGEAEGFVLRRQRDGMAVGGEDQLGMGIFLGTRIQAILQHHAGKAIARQAGGGQAPHRHFGVGIVGRGQRLGFRRFIFDRKDVGERFHQWAFRVRSTSSGVRAKTSRSSVRL